METTALLIEDNKADYVRIRAYLQNVRSHKIQLEWVSTYEEGRRAMVENKHDIYLLDFRLDGHDGIKLLEEVLQNGCHRPVIFLTGYGDFSLDVRAMECGAADFLEKDRIDSLMLERSIRYALQNWKARTELEASLREKETLLKEVHHRVKNNLQVIASMLRLQSRRIKEGETDQAFQECCDRVRSIGLIHDQLYRSETLDAVNFLDYVEALVKQLLNAYAVDPNRIAVDIKVEHQALALSLAVPCGLIVHELLTNALRHAFPNGKSGSVQLSFQRLASGDLELRVKDDGVGMDTNLDAKRDGSLGLELIRAFAVQIQAQLDVHNKVGTEWKLTFPEKTT